MNDHVNRAVMGFVVAILVAVSVGACDLLPFYPPRNGGDGMEWIQTDSDRYRLVQEGSFLRTKIPYVYTNDAGTTIYIVNCRGVFPQRLERREAGRWVGTYGNAVRDCLSPPIVIEEGDTYADTLVISAGAYGSNISPQFDRADPTGTYRIVWGEGNVLTSFDENAQPFGEPIPEEQRISNLFRLEVE